MSQAMTALPSLPAPLTAAVETYKQRFIERSPEYQDWFERQLKEAEFSLQLARAWASSQYSFDLCCRQPQFFKLLVDQKLLWHNYQGSEMAEQLTAKLQGCEDVDSLNQQLRQFRSLQMLRIIWRDVNRLAPLLETTADISALAQACIGQAMGFHHQQLSRRYGVPTAQVDGQPVEQRMTVLGMGKLGAWELNLSSDVDLIFCYPHRGQTVIAAGQPRSLDNSEFFTQLARALIQSLDQVTADGFVFRVDMRLRPYGQSGALVLSFGAMEEYYQDQGRDWERYAMIKARVVAGEPQQGERLMTLLQPFIYRRYIDFSTVESLRAMKRMIVQEVKRRQLDNDIKLGAGGIREVEFIAQSFQLIRGGRETELQERRLLPVLALLAEKAYLPQVAVDELQKAYIFLRNTEHVLQAANDQQTQLLPSDARPQAVVAFAMGFASWSLFSDALAEHRRRVAGHFGQLIADPEDVESRDDNRYWEDFWAEEIDPNTALPILTAAGFDDTQAVLVGLTALRQGRIVVRMEAVARARLDQFMPLLLQNAASSKLPSVVLLRTIPLVEAVLRRTAYLVLLVENPAALQQLIILCAASPWIASQLAKQPVLLDELLDARSLYQVPEKAALRDELKQRLLRLPWHDLEGHMDGLRYFMQAHRLRVSAAEVTGKLALIKVSDYLTVIAEVVLEHVLDVAWFNLTEKHGRPPQASESADGRGFLVVAYGKLGGIELGHSSDLDLVFIHDGASNTMTDGEQPVDNSVFFTRLGQRMIHILSTATLAGTLYEVDMRLRPSGASGLLVSSFEAFASYQQHKAWTWEHQALVRARPVAGDPDLAQKFAQLRTSILCQPREMKTLQHDVATMREKMREHLLPKGQQLTDAAVFHLKQGVGAIVDIEFMVQYAVLAWSHQHPALAHFTDNLRILNALQQAAILSETQAQALIDAYTVYRSCAHRLSLQQQPSELPVAKFAAQRKIVLEKWRELLG